MLKDRIKKLAAAEKTERADRRKSMTLAQLQQTAGRTKQLASMFKGDDDAASTTASATTSPARPSSRSNVDGSPASGRVRFGSARVAGSSPAPSSSSTAAAPTPTSGGGAGVAATSPAVTATAAAAVSVPSSPPPIKIDRNSSGSVQLPVTLYAGNDPKPCLDCDCQNFLPSVWKQLECRECFHKITRHVVKKKGPGTQQPPQQPPRRRTMPPIDSTTMSALLAAEAEKDRIAAGGASTTPTTAAAAAAAAATPATTAAASPSSQVAAAPAGSAPRLRDAERRANRRSLPPGALSAMTAAGPLATGPSASPSPVAAAGNSLAPGGSTRTTRARTPSGLGSSSTSSRAVATETKATDPAPAVTQEPSTHFHSPPTDLAPPPPPSAPEPRTLPDQSPQQSSTHALEPAPAPKPDGPRELEPITEPEPTTQPEPIVEPELPRELEPEPETVTEHEREPEPEPEAVPEPKVVTAEASTPLEPPLPEHPPPPLHEHEHEQLAPITTCATPPSAEAPTDAVFVDSEAIAEGISNPQDITCFPEELRKSYLGAFVAIALISDHQLDSRMALCLQDSADNCGLSAQSMVEIRDVAFDDPGSVRDFLRHCLVILSHSVLRYSVALDILSIVYASRAECRERRLPTSLEEEGEGEGEGESEGEEAADDENKSQDGGDSDEERGSSSKSERTTTTTGGGATTETEALRLLFDTLGITPEQQQALERYTEAFIQVIDAGDDDLLLEPLDDTPSATTFTSLFAACSLPRNAVFRSGKTPLGMLLIPALDRVHAKLLAGEQQASGRASDDDGSGSDGDNKQSDEDGSDHADGSEPEAEAEDEQHGSGEDDGAKSGDESGGSDSGSGSEARHEDSGSDREKHSGSVNDDAGTEDEQDADDEVDEDEDDGPGFTIDFISEIQARKRAAINCTIS